MLFPSAQEARKLADHLQGLAAITGGTIPPLHVTVGYFHGAASIEAVAERLRVLRGPRVTIHATDLVARPSDGHPHPLFGYTLSLLVHRDEGVQCWQRAAIDAVKPLGLVPTFRWEEQRPHVQVIRHLAISPPEVLARASVSDWSLSFTTDRLVASVRDGEEFVVFLEQPVDSET